MPKEKNIVADVGDIATDVLVEALKRRAAARSMTVDELLAEAGLSWDKAEREIENLGKLGHE